LFAVTSVVSVFAGVRLLSNLYTGGLTDRFGTRQAVGWGAIIVALSSLLIATSQTYWHLLAYRAFGGFGSALFFNALLTHVVRLVGPERRGRAVGSLQGAFLFGISFGPIVGGFLAEPLGLRWPFVIYAVFCGAAGVVGLLFLPPMTARERPTDVPAVPTANRWPRSPRPPSLGAPSLGAPSRWPPSPAPPCPSQVDGKSRRPGPAGSPSSCAWRPSCAGTGRSSPRSC
jgi:MFS family permease